MTTPRRPGGAQRIPRPSGWADEAVDAVFLGRPPRLDDLDTAITLEPLEPDFDTWARPAGARDSAVLVLLTDGPEGVEVLLTTRSMELRNHRGEVSFPGGRVDPGETYVQAAQREADEEVGLDPAEVTIRGALSPLHTMVSSSFIVPIVATTPHRLELAPASMEVARLFWLPLVELSRADTYHAENWGVRYGDLPAVLHFFELDDETVWGATARILIDLLERFAAVQAP